MPFKSTKQRSYLWAFHPEIARRWEDEAKAKGRPSIQALATKPKGKHK